MLQKLIRQRSVALALVSNSVLDTVVVTAICKFIHPLSGFNLRITT